MGASESKLEFKEDIFRLAGEDNIPLESSWWAKFILLPESPSDVQALWSPNDLRALTLNAPPTRPFPGAQITPKKNAETLIYRCIARLQNPQNSPWTEAGAATHAAEEGLATAEILNAVRILTRLLPYLYEADHLSEWEDSFFWLPRLPVAYPDPKPGGGYAYKDGLTGTLIPFDRRDETLGPPLGEVLVDTLINYLFLPGFTLPARVDAQGRPVSKPVYAVWRSGIGANKGAGPTKENDRNAVEILRLLLVLAGRTMYFPPGVVAERDVKVLTYLTARSDRAVVLNVICSLLNTVLKHTQSPWTFPIDLGVGSTTKDSKQPLVTSCLHFLLVLITYPVPGNNANEFRKALGRLHRAEDFQFIVEGLRQILVQPASGLFRPVQNLTPTTLASSLTSSTSNNSSTAPETLSLFWELLQCNRRFRAYLIETDRAGDFVVLTLYYAIDTKDDPARQSVVRMCIFILQTLSVEERFGGKLNVPFATAGQEALPAVLRIRNFRGTLGDFLIAHIHTLLTSNPSNRALESLHPALLAIVNNIAPYIRNLQRATSVMIFNVFVSLSQPGFLLAAEGNHVLLESCLDAINAVLEFQLQETGRFLEVIIKGRRRFEALRDFTVDGALAELDRLAMERKDAGESAGVRTPSSRGGSLEYSRGNSISSRGLGDVPEDSAFALDDDEDEGVEDGDADVDDAEVGVDASDSLPIQAQARNLSEKARGKRPIGAGDRDFSTNSRASLSSRNASDASLPSLNHAVSHTHTHIHAPLREEKFTPTYEWLNTWLPHLNLHTILTTVQQHDETFSAHGARQASTDSRNPDPQIADADANADASTRHHIDSDANGDTDVNDTSDATSTAQHPRPRSPNSTSTSDLPRAPSARAEQHAGGIAREVKVQTFRWTSLALGWYISLLWGRIYAADSASLRIWVGTGVRLFNVVNVKQEGISLLKPRGAVDAVGGEIARRIGGISLSSLGGGGGLTGREV